MMHSITLYTDGGCSPNPGPGAWACVLVHTATGKERELTGYDPDSTNNRMEIQAVIEGLAALKAPCAVTVVTDSQYVQGTMTQGWKRKRNHDLWQRLDALCQTHAVTWQWTPGHAGQWYNERCDNLVQTTRYRGKVGLLR